MAMKTCTACAGTGHPPLVNKRDYSRLCATCGGSGQIYVKEPNSTYQSAGGGGCLLLFTVLVSTGFFGLILLTIVW